MASNLHMKKLLLLSAVLLGLGAASSSYAGVRLDIGLPLPPLPGVVIRPPHIWAPPVVVAPPSLSFGFPGGYDNCYPGGYYGGYYGRGGYYGHGWDHRRYDRWDHHRDGRGDHRGSHGRW